MQENPLDILLHDGVIDEVLGRLKSGKEADVYLVQQRDRVVAAKVYKDRAQRSFKNNSDYKEGRKVRSSRTQRAIDSGSKFGRAAAEDAWKSTEANALSRLHAHGVRVPEPIMFYEGVLLMGLVTGPEGQPAPRLIDVAHDAETARAMYVDLRGQIVRMLCCEIIHGDLSPYNILLAAAGPTIIDFPQVVSAAHSSRSEFFFQRDFENVLRFLCASDSTLVANMGDGRKIWRAYLARDLTPEFVPSVSAPDPYRPPRPPQEQRPRPPQQARPPQQHPHRGGGDPRHRPGPIVEHRGGPRQPIVEHMQPRQPAPPRPVVVQPVRPPQAGPASQNDAEGSGPRRRRRRRRR